MPFMITSAFGSNLIKVLVEEPRHGYVYRREIVNVDPENPDANRTAVLDSGYTLDGDWIGDVATAEFLAVKKGLVNIQKGHPDHSVCTVGFQPREQKWYGWSHRAIAGFGVGDRIFEEDFGDDQTPFHLHGARPITTLDEAKQSASAFATSVS